MAYDDSADELEKRGVALAQSGDYAQARRLFQQALPLRHEPLRRAQVLQNIGLTYAKEGNTGAAIATYKEILETPGLQDTWEGVSFHGRVTGYISRLEGRPVPGWSNLISLFAAYSTGAAFGAVLGASALSGTDLRYGGAVTGAVVGFFLFARAAAGVWPGLAATVGFGNLLLTAYMLLESDIQKGLPILAILILMPLGLFMLSSIRRER